jgi:hypothetical protein
MKQLYYYIMSPGMASAVPAVQRKQLLNKKKNQEATIIIIHQRHGYLTENW